MRAITLDETLEISRRAQSLLAQRGVHLTFASSVEELPTAFAVSGLGDLLIANLSGEFGGWQVAEHLRRTRFNGRTVALVDSLDSSNVAYLSQSPRTQCLLRPSSPGALEALLAQIFAGNCSDQPDRGSRQAGTLSAFHGIVGASPAMQEVFSRIEKAAAGNANVCIYGESGTGKELVATAIHEAGARRNRPFVPLDCTAIPEGLVESHLFGHVKGAFTGAVDEREGVFSLAHTGTLFMDELGELPPTIQAKLLRVLQTREFVKVGGTRPIRTSIRLITASNQDLQRTVELGKFREDLYYRVAVIMIRVPPLRERREDIPLLVQHFLERFSAAYQTSMQTVTASAMERLMAEPWPGNVRQLENLIEQAVVLADGETLAERELALESPRPSVPSTLGTLSIQSGLPLREVERRYILNTLREVQGNRTLAARRLGVSVRCLQYKLKQYLEERASAVVPVNGLGRVQRMVRG